LFSKNYNADFLKRRKDNEVVDILAFKLVKPNALNKESLEKHSISQPMEPFSHLQFIEVVPKSLITRKEMYINESNLFGRSVNSDNIHTVSRYLQLLVVRRKALRQNHNVQIQ
jgi:hypothetical protein